MNDIAHVCTNSLRVCTQYVYLSYCTFTIGQVCAHIFLLVNKTFLFCSPLFYLWSDLGIFSFHSIKSPPHTATFR